MTVSSTPEEVEVSFGKGLRGSLTIPGFDKDLRVPHPTNKAALILHGQGGHRNNCYQKYLAHKLTKHLGMYTLRIDFRGCGASAPGAKTRNIDQDLEDTRDSVDFLLDPKKNNLGLSLTITFIAGHSRAASMVLLYVKEEDLKYRGTEGDKAVVIPNVVNGASRFDSLTVYDQYPELQDKSVKDVKMKIPVDGKMHEFGVPRSEIESRAMIDLSNMDKLSPEISVLTVLGVLDTTILLSDGIKFANVLNRGPGSHQLEMIQNADHNYYGKVPILTEEDAKKHNPKNLPLRRSLVNYNFQAADIMMNFVSPENEMKRFHDATLTSGMLTRWKNIDGVCNFRDVGIFRIKTPRYTSPSAPEKCHHFFRPGAVFRSANLSGISEDGVEELSHLRVKAVFDLRSTYEVGKAGVPQNLEKYGITRYHTPVIETENGCPKNIAHHFKGLTYNWQTYMEVYEDMLKQGVPAFKQIFEYIRDHSVKDGSIVLYCTAGKDRTGVVVMLLLLFMGVEKYTVCREYGLSNFGLEEEREPMRARFSEVMKEFGLVIDMGPPFNEGEEAFTYEETGFNNLVTSRADDLLMIIDNFIDNNGGIIKFMKENIGLTESDLEKIYNNLVQYKDITRKMVSRSNSSTM